MYLLCDCDVIFVNKVIRDLGSIDHYPVDRINTQVIYQFALAQVECTS